MNIRLSCLFAGLIAVAPAVTAQGNTGGQNHQNRQGTCTNPVGGGAGNQNGQGNGNGTGPGTGTCPNPNPGTGQGGGNGGGTGTGGGNGGTGSGNGPGTGTCPNPNPGTGQGGGNGGGAGTGGGNGGTGSGNGPGTGTCPNPNPGTGQGGGNGGGTGTGGGNGGTGSGNGPGTGTCPNPNPGTGQGGGNGGGTGTGGGNGGTGSGNGPGTGGNGNGGNCPNTGTDDGPSTPPTQGNALITAYIDTLPIEAVSATERLYLEYMREEEKLARDLYRAFAQTWQLPTFANIADAEQSHMDLVLYVMQRNQVPDPMPSNRPGEYLNPLCTQLYQLGVAFGSLSPFHAQLVGAIVEDLDMHDLHTALAGSDNRDLDTVWQNLDRGSRNHMRAFYGQLLNQSFLYGGLFLTTAELTAIVTTPFEIAALDENGNPL